MRAVVVLSLALTRAFVAPSRPRGLAPRRAAEILLECPVAAGADATAWIARWADNAPELADPQFPATAASGDGGAAVPAAERRSRPLALTLL